MCDFCILYDFSKARAKVSNGVATIEIAPQNIPFLPKSQFRFCPMCGSPVNCDGMTISSSFPNNLRRIRRMRGMTQAELGMTIGVQKSAISKYEKGRAKPSIYQLAELCRQLDVSPQELI